MKHLCKRCNEHVDVDNETKRISTHRRVKSRHDYEESVHLRNITDELCPGSQMVIDDEDCYEPVHLHH